MNRCVSRAVILFVAGCLGLTGCRSLYYGFYEKLGVEKRHLLRRNVEKAQKEQTQAAKEFKDVLTRIKDLYGFEGGDLERVYRKLNGDYEGLSQRADSIRERIAKVRQVGADLFAEWEKEIAEISTANLRAKSEASLRDARRRFETLERALEQSESRMGPVLAQVHDYVLALKHNLNAAAVGALQGEAGAIEQDVARLIEDMNRSIQEAESFLAAFE